MNKKDKLLIKWIKNEQLERPNSDFTRDFLKVLKENETSLRTEDMILNKVLKHKALDPIARGFTKHVVSLIEMDSKNQEIEPLISKKVLGTIISSILLLSLLFEIYNNSEQIEMNSVFLDIIHSTIKFIQETPIILVCIMVGAVFILTLEKIFQTMYNTLFKK